MAPEIKFCGMTRPGDAGYAAELGAAYVGVIFAESPRKVSEDTARAVFDAAGPSLRHVAVFAAGSIDVIAETATRVDAHVAQIHFEHEPSEVERLRKKFSGDIWTVISLDPNSEKIPREAFDLSEFAHAILLDARVANRSGGTGRQLAWARIADDVAKLAEKTSIILAGGLKPENVAEAISVIKPSIVDVSSGVEASPGIKDRPRMKAFAEAVRSASIVGWNTTSDTGPGSK